MGRVWAGTLGTGAGEIMVLERTEKAALSRGVLPDKLGLCSCTHRAELQQSLPATPQHTVPLQTQPAQSAFSQGVQDKL